MEMFDNYEAFIITNGYLMNSEVVQAFKRYKVKGVQITIDGLEETHNQRRPHCTNKDSFQVIIKNLTTLFEEYPEVRVSLRVNVDKSNEDEYHELYHFLKDRFGDYHINIHPGYVTDDFSEVSVSADGSKWACHRCSPFENHGTWTIPEKYISLKNARYLLPACETCFLEKICNACPASNASIKDNFPLAETMCNIRKLLFKANAYFSISMLTNNIEYAALRHLTSDKTRLLADSAKTILEKLS